METHVYFYVWFLLFSIIFLKTYCSMVRTVPFNVQIILQWAGNIAQLEESLFSKHKALGSIPSTAKRKEKKCIVCIYCDLLIQSCIHVYLACLYPLANVYATSESMCSHAFEYLVSFPLGMHLGVELCHMIILWFLFGTLPNCFPQWQNLLHSHL